MAKRFPGFFDSPWFAAGIASAMLFLGLWLSGSRSIVAPLELASQDWRMAFSLDSPRTKTMELGTVYTERSLGLSDDILIVGLDDYSLYRYGQLPLDKSLYARFIDLFSRIRNQGQRENSIYLGLLLNDSKKEKSPEDKALAASMLESGRVVIPTSFVWTGEEKNLPDLMARQQRLYDRLGSLRNIKGPWESMGEEETVNPPLGIYASAAAGYGHGDFRTDRDGLLRRESLVVRSATLVEELRLDSLSPGFEVDRSRFEYLEWKDTQGLRHRVATPLTAKGLAALRREMEAKAPPGYSQDSTGLARGDRYYVLERMRDHFVPSAMLSLAARYFGKGLDELELVVGDHIRIPSPTILDAYTGTRVPYRIRTTHDTFDKGGNLVKEGQSRAVPYIDIPIDDNCRMAIRYAGYGSRVDGGGTYTVRPFASYVDKEPGPRGSGRSASMAAANKLILVGPFLDSVGSGTATPLGFMNMIEIDANILNTIIMDSFIRPAPALVNALILAASLALVTLACLRLNPLLAFLSAIAFVFLGLAADTVVFSLTSILVNWAGPSTMAILDAIAILAWRTGKAERSIRSMGEDSAR